MNDKTLLVNHTQRPNATTVQAIALPKSNLYRWEIASALVIKILFLVGLWFLIFRWSDKPVTKPDIAEHLLQTAIQTQIQPEISSLTKKESNHVR